MPKIVLILGGGPGGLTAASRLRQMLGAEHRVVLVDRSPYYTYGPSLTWVMVGKRQLPRITRDIRDIRKRGIEVKIAEITDIDANQKRVTLTKETIDYDYLVIALGTVYSDAEVPGLGRAWTFYHPDGAEGMAEELPNFSSGRIVVSAPRLPYKCPPSLYEGALLLDAYYRKAGLRENIEITVTTPENEPLYQYPGCGERVLTLLRSRKIAFRGGARMTSVDSDNQQLHFANGDPLAFDMLVAAPVHRLPPMLDSLGLNGPDGWIAADAQTLATGAPDVYAIGDCNTVLTPAGEPLPKSGTVAEGEAEVVARNIAAEITGEQPTWAFGGESACSMETDFSHGATISANHFAEPPKASMRGPSRLAHWAKVGAERVWLS
ncbi:MAG: FAD/NAD(P)-binding oxidoreductase, partial [Chloroflexota bacterium]